jgi:hypothetical protein
MYNWSKYANVMTRRATCTTRSRYTTRRRVEKCSRARNGAGESAHGLVRGPTHVIMLSGTLLSGAPPAQSSRNASPKRRERRSGDVGACPRQALTAPCCRMRKGGREGGRGGREGGEGREVREGGRGGGEGGMEGQALTQTLTPPSTTPPPTHIKNRAGPGRAELGRRNP